MQLFLAKNGKLFPFLRLERQSDILTVKRIFRKTFLLQFSFLFDEFRKDFRRNQRIVKRAVVVEREPVIPRHGIEFIVPDFSCQKFLRKR